MADKPNPVPVTLHGSCHCGKVAFTVDSFTPYPIMICHCITDTKTSGFYNCNIKGETNTLVIQGSDPSAKKIYQAKLPDNTISSHERHFCGNCGSSLYAFDKRWAEGVYPFASCIDKPDLPVVEVENQIHIMTEFKHPCVVIPKGVKHTFTGYPNKSIDDWHKENGLYGSFHPQ
eukprot:TRINITY_DN6177_c0_g5_i1.p1 TRINITY_DN6177_c0_g5~~TRINITY_DN6177_c0_g5_i1.p1  ORF type:complete len:187 (-),score=46.36 TRINITY_DN6177_c0_g5_i1:256-777(-)